MTIVDISNNKFNYEEIVKMCKEKGLPIYLSKNGQVELVVMDIESFEKREQKLKAQQLALEAYASRLSGEKDYSQKEAMEIIDRMISEAK
jgi:PHD/YefM family antitoxin component YafN of YafNO toxin-antitoxin module